MLLDIFKILKFRILSFEVNSCVQEDYYVGSLESQSTLLGAKLLGVKFVVPILAYMELEHIGHRIGVKLE